MEDFYRHSSPVDKADGSRLWFVQFLLVLALGKALLSQSKNKRDPPAARLFTRAMSLMPDHGEMWKNSLMAIDVLCLTALYLYSIDHRESANVYVSIVLNPCGMPGWRMRLTKGGSRGGRFLRRYG